MTTPTAPTTEHTYWVCRHCGGSRIAALSMVPRSQGTGPLYGTSPGVALDYCSWDDGHDVSYWEAEERTGYECRDCDARVTEQEGIGALIVPEAAPDAS